MNDAGEQIEWGLGYIKDTYAPLRWWERVLQFGKYWSFEHKGFSGWGSGRIGIGFGLEFAVGRDHCFIHLRLLDRGIDLQWEAGFAE